MFSSFECIGYWSSGTRLADSARVSGDGIEAGDFPEYMARKHTPSRVPHHNIFYSVVVPKVVQGQALSADAERPRVFEKQSPLFIPADKRRNGAKLGVG